MANQYKTDISVGAPPLVWSNVQQAFDEINQNFLILGTVLQTALDLDPLNFTNLESSIAPNNSNQFSLGSETKTWKNLYVAEWFDIPGNQLNGIWLGDAQIKGTGNTVDLPANSTVNGQLIINPANTTFKTVAVPTQTSIVADSFTDTLTIVPTTGISLTTDAGTDTLTIGNTGVRSLQGSTYVGVSSPTGDNITLTNLGVTNLQAGPGISLSQTTGTVEVTNSGIRNITSGGGGISVSIDSSTRTATIGNTTPTTRSFATILVNGVTELVANSATDVLRVVPGYGITVAGATGFGTSGLEDQLTISFDNNVDIIGSVYANGTDLLVDAVGRQFYGDLNGSVFSDASTMLVDGTNGRIVGNVETPRLRTSDANITLGNGAGTTNQTSGAIAIGTQAGETNQSFAISIGAGAGQSNQGFMATAIGGVAGQVSQGTYAVAIGANAGLTSQGSIAVGIGQNAGEINQGSAGVAIGYYAGKDTQESGAVAIGYTTAQITQRQAAVAIGWSAGQTNQGAYSIALGYRAGFTNQHASSIILNGSGVALNSTGAGFYVNPIRSNANGTPLMYDASTSELFYSNVLEFIGSKISTIDSSSILFDSPVNFQTAVIVDSDLTVKDDLHIMGTWYGDVQDVSSTDSVVDISPTGAINSNIIYSNPLSAQDIIIPNAAAEPGKRYVISNGNGASTITLKDASANTITTIGPDSAKEVISNGFAWQVL